MFAPVTHAGHTLCMIHGQMDNKRVSPRWSYGASWSAYTRETRCAAASMICCQVDQEACTGIY
eukprot:1153025-Pelagomonas_calceolata.AAC.5